MDRRFSYHHLWMLLSFLHLIHLGCTEAGENFDTSATESSCAAVTGTWTLDKVYCDGVSTSFSGHILNFDTEGQILQQQGNSFCSETLMWNRSQGSDVNSLFLEGQGSNICGQGSMLVSSCSDLGFSCSETTSFAGQQQQFASCALTATGVVLSRVTSTTTDSSGRSYCADGQEEVLEYVEASSPPAVPGQVGELIVVEGSTHPFGTVNLGNSQLKTLTLHNQGNGTVTSIATSLDAPFAFEGGAYPGLYGTCGSSLAPGASCTVSLQMLPTVNGAVSEDWEIDYYNSQEAATLSVNLSGAGFSPLGHLEIVGTRQYDFGNVMVSSETRSQIFTIANNGAAGLTFVLGTGLASPFGFTGVTFPGVGGTCASSLNSGETCTVEVECTPASIGDFEDRLEITYDNGVNDLTVTLDVICHGTP